MKDYVKRSAKPVRSQSVNGNWFNNLMLLLAIFFAGFACAHLIQEYLLPKFKIATTLSSSSHVSASAKKITPSHVTTLKKSSLSSSPVKASAQQPATEVQPKFDFYKLLPQMTVNVPVDDDTVINPALLNTKLASKTVTPTYVLQIASLKKEADAAQIQNTLKSSGYSAFLQPYQAPDHIIWYRVLIGPFHDLKTAQVIQDKLDAQQTEALLTTMAK